MPELDLAQMEHDILRAVHTLGPIIGESPARKELIDKYTADNEMAQQITAVLEYLVDERYLMPFPPPASGPNFSIRGITPKGIRRLEKLEHPVRTWVYANWFPVAVAAITTAVGIASIVSNWVRG